MTPLRLRLAAIAVVVGTVLSASVAPVDAGPPTLPGRVVALDGDALVLVDGSERTVLADGFAAPIDHAFLDGRFFLLDATTLLEIDLATGAKNEVASDLGDIGQIAAGRDEIFFADRGGRVGRVELTSGTVTDVVTGLAQPGGLIYIDSDNPFLLYAETDAAVLRGVPAGGGEPTRAIEGVDGPGPFASVRGPLLVVAAATGVVTVDVDLEVAPLIDIEAVTSVDRLDTGDPQDDTAPVAVSSAEGIVLVDPRSGATASVPELDGLRGPVSAVPDGVLVRPTTTTTPTTTTVPPRPSDADDIDVAVAAAGGLAAVLGLFTFLGLGRLALRKRRLPLPPLRGSAVAWGSPVDLPPPVFADGFETGDLANWIDQADDPTVGSALDPGPAPPSDPCAEIREQVQDARARARVLQEEADAALHVSDVHTDPAEDAEALSARASEAQLAADEAREQYDRLRRQLDTCELDADEALEIWENAVAVAERREAAITAEASFASGCEHGVWAGFGYSVGGHAAVAGIETMEIYLWCTARPAHRVAMVAEGLRVGPGLGGERNGVAIVATGLQLADLPGAMQKALGGLSWEVGLGLPLSDALRNTWRGRGLPRDVVGGLRRLAHLRAAGAGPPDQEERGVIRAAGEAAGDFPESRLGRLVMVPSGPSVSLGVWYVPSVRVWVTNYHR